MSDEFIGTNQTPMSQDGVCRNNAQEDRFTCPGCYDDLEPRTGVQVCSCGAVVACSNEQPVERDSVARMIPIEMAEEYEDSLEDLGIALPANQS